MGGKNHLTFARIIVNFACFNTCGHDLTKKSRWMFIRMSVSNRLCPELLPSVPLDLAFAHLAELSKLISVISVNPTRHSEWTIKITGIKVTMAELSQLGATGESLVEDSLGEVRFIFFDTDMKINDINPSRKIYGNKLKGQEIHYK